MLFELKNKYGTYFQFTLKSYYSYLYCCTYGIVGIVGFWLYQTGINTAEDNLPQIDNAVLKTLGTAMIIGWSQGIAGYSHLPARDSDKNNGEGFRFRVLLDFIFLNAIIGSITLLP